ncbi:unnamed protein product [Coregonus sp. 'balchen']|nr:unnamed protein product [Coregonus sp. 'balchen']
MACPLLSISMERFQAIAFPFHNEKTKARIRKAQEIVGAVCLLTPTARERGQKRTEGKLAKCFGYIVITFTLFWMPMVQSWVLRELET